MKSGKACSHVWAAARDLGTQIYWDGCDLSNEDTDISIDHKCSVIEEEKKLNCKLYRSEEGSSKKNKSNY